MSIVKVLHVVGARPNFMKVAPVLNALKLLNGITQVVVHTGQHYDFNMSQVFFEQLGIPSPDVNLSVGPGTHAWQTAEIMNRIEPVLTEAQPDMVLVYGDVNSAVATALVCAKLRLRLGHVEAGLRSFDRTMPEEINRVITDQLSDVLFTPSEDGDENLRNEGISAERIFRVGNVMIDSLVRLLPLAKEHRMNDLPQRYALVTLHRPANVDHAENLKNILSSLLQISDDLPVIFPVHPRTKQRIAELNVDTRKLKILDPLPYLEFLNLQSNSTAVITDSGGVQEETTWLRVPCLTLRDNTERPITVCMGSNVLVGSKPQNLKRDLLKALDGTDKNKPIPPLWDGHTGERIADLLVQMLDREWDGFVPRDFPETDIRHACFVGHDCFASRP